MRIKVINFFIMKIGLFFGSFNPIHVGHLIIANYMVTNTDLKQVWLVVSPQNPFKKKSSLANDYDRLHLANLAVEGNPNLQVSKIEFGLPQPSYTVDTLAYLKEKHPAHEFVLIMGGDNIASFHKWKNYEHILAHHEIYVYSRPNYKEGDLINHPKVHSFEAPLMEISASYIRQCIKEGKSVKYLVTQPVLEALESTTLYR